MNSWQDTLRLCEELEQVIKKHGPMQNEHALRECQNLCFQLQSADGYIIQKLSGLAQKLPIYFSARRHANYNQGLQGLKVAIASDISSIRQQAMAAKMREEQKRDE